MDDCMDMQDWNDSTGWGFQQETEGRRHSEARKRLADLEDSQEIRMTVEDWLGMQRGAA